MNIGIIGGGASGMVLASMIKNSNVTLIERNSKLGRKLLLTGNGKCNFTNDDFENLDDIYNNDFAKKIYSRYDKNEFINFMNDIGIKPKKEVHKRSTYYYPNSNKATSVYYALYDRILSNNVKILYDTFVDNVVIKDNKFYVHSKNNCYEFDKLVIATGGKSYKNTGSDGSFFKIINDIGHKVVKPVPALCGIDYIDNDLKKIKGVRVDAKVIAKVCAESDIEKEFVECGEIQFTENGISGIPVMNLSRKINRYIDSGYNTFLYIDFYDTNNAYDYNDINYSEKEYQNLILYLKNRQKHIYYKSSKDFLCGFLPDELAEVVLKRCNIAIKKVKDLTDKEIEDIAHNLQSFKIDSLSIKGFDNAQITIGGIDENEINNDSLESKLYKGLYFIGEVINIDGKCGGYNLQLAFSTAAVVNESILSGGNDNG